MYKMMSRAFVSYVHRWNHACMDIILEPGVYACIYVCVYVCMYVYVYVSRVLQARSKRMKICNACAYVCVCVCM